MTGMSNPSRWLPVNFLNVGMGQRRKLTMDSNIDLFVLALITTGDAARVAASVWTLELRDGQNTVEQHFCLMFHEPFESWAGIDTLQDNMTEEPWD